MSEKRRDQRGRILKTGESHRKDGLYMFRYTDTRKQRRYIYARSLRSCAGRRPRSRGTWRTGSTMPPGR